jgi:hypothetical protein
VHRPHVGHVHAKRKHDRQHFDDHAVDELADSVHVARGPINDRAALAAVEEAEAEALQLVVNVGAQLHEHPLAERGNGDCCGIPQRGREHGDQQDAAGDQFQDVRARPVVGEAERRRQMAGRHRATQLLADEVDTDARQSQSGEAGRHHDDLQHDDLRAAPAIAPR